MFLVYPQRTEMPLYADFMLQAQQRTTKLPVHVTLGGWQFSSLTVDSSQHQPRAGQSQISVSGIGQVSLNRASHS